MMSSAAVISDIHTGTAAYPPVETDALIFYLFFLPGNILNLPGEWNTLPLWLHTTNNIVLNKASLSISIPIFSPVF